jgi:hypothetical protein
MRWLVPGSIFRGSVFEKTRGVRSSNIIARRYIKTLRDG